MVNPGLAFQPPLRPSPLGRLLEQLKMPDVKDGAAPHADMQAVLVIHGMGEQIPMDTIKDFVNGVWQKDDAITANGLPGPTQVWSKPDARTGSLELRRITTRESIPSPPEFPAGVRTDFYELYWADLTAGETWDSLKAWVSGLLFRPLSRVPRGVRPAWALLWIGCSIVVALAVLSILPSSFWSYVGFQRLADWQWLLAALAVAFIAVVHRMGTSTFGRVVRYTRAEPDNIAARAAVRDRGLKLLQALHDSPNHNGPNYKRIVVVAHSLGTILAHDLLSYFWAEHEPARTFAEGTPEFTALAALERAASQLEDAPRDPRRLNEYLVAQRQLRLHMASRQPDQRWLVSDLITFGSPLTHAEFLLASDRADLDARKASRELPQSPPYREFLDPKVLEHAEAAQIMPIAAPANQTRLMSFPIPNLPKKWALHHAAPFAAVRWTNVFDPATLVFFGDVIGGPLAGVFGPAIIDINLKERRGGRQSWSFTHTKYWDVDEASRIRVCREAVNLLDRPSPISSH
jgi:hypothetical protein